MKYVHTNIVARDWKRLSKFYQDALECVPVPPERDLEGEWIDAVTGLKGVHIVGEHLLLPGCGPDGPTLEIFQYNQGADRLPQAVCDPGFGHIAFLVDEVDVAADRFFAHGGTPVGEIAARKYPDGRSLIVQYVADPEGNIVELQSWSEE